MILQAAAMHNGATAGIVRKCVSRIVLRTKGFSRGETSTTFATARVGHYKQFIALGVYDLTFRFVSLTDMASKPTWNRSSVSVSGARMWVKNGLRCIVAFIVSLNVFFQVLLD